MKSTVFYKFMSGFYDLIDPVYFRNYEKSPRKVVLEAINEEDRVLDLCTGTATNAIRIAKALPTTKVMGIDISKDMLRVAKGKLLKQQVDNVKLCAMDATNTTFKDNCFDKILISLVLHELEETQAEAFLNEAKRVLKEDGRIIVTEWKLSETFWRKMRFLPIHLLEPKPYRSFVKKNLYEYFGKLGLQVIEEVQCDYSKVLILKKQ